MINLFTVSDSTGETVNQLASAISIQFPKIEFNRKRFSNIQTKEQCDELLNEAKGQKTVLIVTIISKEIIEYLKSLQSEDLLVIDLLNAPVSEIEKFAGIQAAKEVGLMRDLDTSYFDKIEAIEFAMNFDDGKNPQGFLEADIVLLGVSRTSKTPLSVYLANKSYKVANLPLVPEISIPDQIYDVDKKKLIGLIIDPDKLNEIRNQRLVALGLSAESAYATDDRIHEELNYAKELYKELGCYVIDVSKSTIEETAAKVIEHIEK